jgi:hypothetical protein
MRVLAFNCRGMQAKVGISIAKHLEVALNDIAWSTPPSCARELVSCLKDLPFVGRVGASNA